jgi:hypothetical protein
MLQRPRIRFKSFYQTLFKRLKRALNLINHHYIAVHWRRGDQLTIRCNYLDFSLNCLNFSSMPIILLTNENNETVLAQIEKTDLLRITPEVITFALFNKNAWNAPKETINVSTEKPDQNNAIDNNNNNNYNQLRKRKKSNNNNNNSPQRLLLSSDSRSDPLSNLNYYNLRHKMKRPSLFPKSPNLSNKTNNNENNNNNDNNNRQKMKRSNTSSSSTSLLSLLPTQAPSNNNDYSNNNNNNNNNIMTMTASQKLHYLNIQVALNHNNNNTVIQPTPLTESSPNPYGTNHHNHNNHHLHITNQFIDELGLLVMDSLFMFNAEIFLAFGRSTIHDIIESERSLAGLSFCTSKQQEYGSWCYAAHLYHQQQLSTISNNNNNNNQKKSSNGKELKKILQISMNETLSIFQDIHYIAAWKGYEIPNDYYKIKK